MVWLGAIYVCCYTSFGYDAGVILFEQCVVIFAFAFCYKIIMFIAYSQVRPQTIIHTRYILHAFLLHSIFVSVHLGITTHRSFRTLYANFDDLVDDNDSISIYHDVRMYVLFTVPCSVASGAISGSTFNRESTKHCAAYGYYELLKSLKHFELRSSYKYLPVPTA